VWAVEYEWFSASLGEMDIASPGEIHESMPKSLVWRIVPKAYLWQPRRTRSSFAELYRQRQRRSAQNCREAYAGVTRYDDGPLELAKVLLSPNPAGGILLTIARPNFERFDMKRCHAETKVSLVEALIAVKAYQREHGGLPGQLDDLVPRYLNRVPEDRFAGAPLRYSRESRVVWSVGEDFIDASVGDKYDLHDAAEPALLLAF
jgi:hypothetical protein